MTTREWRQVTVTFPDPHTAEQTARSHLAPILAEAERQQLITAWFYIRKKQGWRVRFAPATHDADRYVVNELERLARDRHLHTIIRGAMSQRSTPSAAPSPCRPHTSSGTTTAATCSSTTTAQPPASARRRSCSRRR